MPTREPSKDVYLPLTAHVPVDQFRARMLAGGHRSSGGMKVLVWKPFTVDLLSVSIGKIYVGFIVSTVLVKGFARLRVQGCRISAGR